MGAHRRRTATGTRTRTSSDSADLYTSYLYPRADRLVFVTIDVPIKIACSLEEDTDCTARIALFFLRRGPSLSLFSLFPILVPHLSLVGIWALQAPNSPVRLWPIQATCLFLLFSSLRGQAKAVGGSYRQAANASGGKGARYNYQVGWVGNRGI